MPGTATPTSEGPADPVPTAADARRASAPSGGRLASGAHRAAPFLAFLAVALVVQLLAGAYGPELTVGADDPAHFVSGLLVRDYLAHGLGTHPLEFARDYYAHYPKIAIGNWPPLFHALEGIWMLLLPVGGSSIFLLLALMAAATAWLVHRTLLPLLGAPFALFGAVAFLVLRPVPALASSVMVEVPLTLACTATALAWVRFVDQGGTRRVVTFAVLLVLAILTKANGLLLLLVPPLSVAISGRWDVLRNRVLWRAILVAAVLVAPLVWLTLPIMRAGWESSHALFGDMGEAAAYYLPQLLTRLGYVPVALVLVGAAVRLRDRASRREGAGVLWSTAAAVVLATLLFHLAAPAGEDARHLLPAYPFLAMFLAAGVHALAGALRAAFRNAVAAATIALVAGSTAVALASLPIRDRHLQGFGPAAELITARPPGRATTRGPTAAPSTPGSPTPGSPTPDSVVVLVSSDPNGEGALVVEMALRDRARPSHVVWRATKLLSTVTWAGRDYVMRPANEAELVRLLDLASVEWVVVDRTREPFPHQQLLASAIATHPDRFLLRRIIPVQRSGEHYPEGIHVYDFVRDTSAPADSLLRQAPGYLGIE